jgi:hypothetical protein
LLDEPLRWHELSLIDVDVRCHILADRADTVEDGPSTDLFPGSEGMASLTFCYGFAVSAKPKKKCCQDKPRCKRCPIRMLAEGNLAVADAKKIFADARNRKALKKAKIEKMPKAA